MKTKNLIIIIVLLALAWVGVMYFQSNNDKVKIEKNTYIEEDDELMVETPTIEKDGILCFGERTKSEFSREGSIEYNYSMLVLDISNPENVQGYVRYYPYGTDSGVSSIKGTYNQENRIIRATLSSYGEGMNYEDNRIWKFENKQLISGYTKAQMGGSLESYKNLDEVIWNTDNPEKNIECSAVDTWLDEVYAQYEYPEDIDYDRISKILNDEDIDENTKITERYLDADNNWETEETLIFIESPAYCGSGGCTMILVNEKDEIITKFTVTRKPVLIGNNIEKKEWTDLVVWSDGSYRLLQHDGKTYPSNPSLAQKLSERDVEWHPEKYFVIMNDSN